MTVLAFGDRLLRNPPSPQSPYIQHRDWQGIGMLRHCTGYPARIVPEHDHGSHALFISLGGRTYLNMPSNGYKHLQPLQIGSVAITPARVMHSAIVEAQSAFMILYLQTGFVERSDEQFADELRPAIANSDPLIQAIGTSLNTDDADPLYAETLLHALSIHLHKRYAWRPAGEQTRSHGLSTHKLRQVCSYIEAHLQGVIRLDDLAETVNLSRYHFCRLFKQSVGVSPYQYILQQRIKKARQLLHNPDLSLVNVALASGFASQSHFSRHFRQHMGVTPYGYRKTLK